MGIAASTLVFQWPGSFIPRDLFRPSTTLATLASGLADEQQCPPSPVRSYTPTSVFPSSPFLLTEGKKCPVSSQDESLYMSKASQGSWFFIIPASLSSRIFYQVTAVCIQIRSHPSQLKADHREFRKPLLSHREFVIHWQVTI